MRMKRLGKAAVVAATVVGVVAGTAGTAQASPRVMTFSQCDKPAITAEPLAGGGWNGGLALCGGGFGHKIASYLYSDGMKQDFFVGADYAVWTAWYDYSGPDAGLRSLASLGGKVTSQPVISAHSGNYLQLKARGTDGKNWYKERYSNGTWSNWYR
ncbi:hypothetical protein [Streptomyces sp. NPDC001985]|uniref:hypothetical protein n=1 Tax=Streptomyces sp. NPDC001985 TaxID=3154406 RepID=UPI003317CC0D